MENQTEKFWAIVELFGHQQLAGEVSKCDIGDFIQINIPQVGVCPEWSKMVNPKAIYGITPVTKDVAIARAETINAIPVSKWDTEQMFKNKFREMEQEGKIKMLADLNDYDDDDSPI